MPEVAGEAAIQVDPFNSKDIAGAKGRVSADKRLRDDMIQKGFVQKIYLPGTVQQACCMIAYCARYRQELIDLSPESQQVFQALVECNGRRPAKFLVDLIVGSDQAFYFQLA